MCDSSPHGDAVEPFIGSEALARGALSRHQLRTQYRAVFPNVYLPNDSRPSLELRTVAAWLWSNRRATIAGAAAAALHGARWIPDDVPMGVSALDFEGSAGMVVATQVVGLYVGAVAVS